MSLVTGDRSEAVELTGQIFKEVVEEEESQHHYMTDADSFFTKAHVCFAHSLHLARCGKERWHEATTVREKGIAELDRFLEIDDSPMAKHFQYRVNSA